MEYLDVVEQRRMPTGRTETSCGIAGKPSGLIINGTQSERGAWPWLAALYLAKGDKFFCGGNLISDNMVVTAAHCIIDKGASKPLQANEIVVKLGKFNLTDPLERGSMTVYPSDIIIHQNWKTYTQNYDSDIAIIVLETQFGFTDKISPICLWDKNHEPRKDNGIVVGWGKSESEAEHESTPKELEVSIVKNEVCFLKNHRFAAISSLNTFCAGKDETSGPCRGDSGSGLFVSFGNRNRRWYLRGIVSASFVNENNECQVSDDSIFTNVVKFNEWILQTSKKVSMSSPLRPNQNPDEKISKKEIFCFFESWAEGRQGDGVFFLNDFRPELCTTAVYLLSNLDEAGDSLKPTNPWQELEDNGGQNLYKRFTSLKKSHNGLRTLLAVGGWIDGSKKYSELAADVNRRKRFAVNSANYLEKYGFDGLHFHWEHPAHRGGSPSDKRNFGLLLQEIHEVYQQENLFLSVFVRTPANIVESAYDMRSIGKYADAILIMTFDFTGYWDQKIEYPAAIYGAGERTIDSRVKYFRDYHGIPSEKLILGIPFFGRSYIASTNGNIGDKTLNDVNFPGPFVNENGFLGYNEICRLRKEYQWELTFDNLASQTIGKFVKNNLTHVVIYDSPRSVANKVKYAFENNLGGVWTWFVDTDDFLGECPRDLTTFSDFTGTKREPVRYRELALLTTTHETFKLMKSIKINDPK
ncbi:CLUMA_CG016342, isoform A [Clunio marinus]|uniref:CLUMA_CG016342, isoform A n=1 Tax=Clunio marinus TaxID=568069 RepID=A0A1J1ITC9_9DIPT|nr:CLUMA_CG016342, isoform A [Clunio marinus]